MAAQQGLIKAGDRLVSINGADVTGATHAAAAALLTVWLASALFLYLPRG